MLGVQLAQLVNDYSVEEMNKVPGSIKKRIGIGVINKQNANVEENNLLRQNMELPEAVCKRRNESRVHLNLDYLSKVEDQAIDSQTEHDKNWAYVGAKKIWNWCEEYLPKLSGLLKLRQIYLR